MEEDHMAINHRCLKPRLAHRGRACEAVFGDSKGEGRCYVLFRRMMRPKIVQNVKTGLFHFRSLQCRLRTEESSVVGFTLTRHA